MPSGREQVWRRVGERHLAGEAVQLLGTGAGKAAGTASKAPNRRSACEMHDPTGEPDAGNPHVPVRRAGGGDGPMGAGLSATAKVSGHAHRTLRAPRHLLTLPQPPLRALGAALGPSFCRGTGSSRSKRLCGRVLRGQSSENRCLSELSLVLGRSGPRRIGWNGYLGGGCGVVTLAIARGPGRRRSRTGVRSPWRP